MAPPSLPSEPAILARQGSHDIVQPSTPLAEDDGHGEPVLPTPVSQDPHGCEEDGPKGRTERDYCSENNPPSAPPVEDDANVQPAHSDQEGDPPRPAAPLDHEGDVRSIRYVRFCFPWRNRCCIPRTEHRSMNTGQLRRIVDFTRAHGPVLERHFPVFNHKRDAAQQRIDQPIPPGVVVDQTSDKKRARRRSSLRDG